MTLYRDILDPSRTVTVTNTDIARWSPLDWDQREINVHGSEEREAENHVQSEKDGWGRKDLGFVAQNTDPVDNDSRAAEGLNPNECDGRDQLECQTRTYEEDEGTHQLEISGVRTVAPSNARVQKHHLARHKHDELRAFITLQLEALGQKQDDPKIQSWIRKHTPYQIIDALQRRIAETPTQDLKGKWWKVVPLTAIPE